MKNATTVGHWRDTRNFESRRAIAFVGRFGEAASAPRSLEARRVARALCALGPAQRGRASCRNASVRPQEDKITEENSFHGRQKIKGNKE